MRPENAFYNLAVNISQPLLDGFLLEGQLELTLGRQFELVKTYCQTILSSFGDVEIALIAIADGAERERLQNLVVTSSREAFRLAETRLREGTVDLVTVLQTQQTLFTAEDQHVVARLARLQAVLSLFQALGGAGFRPAWRRGRTCAMSSNGDHRAPHRRPRHRRRGGRLLHAALAADAGGLEGRPARRPARDRSRSGAGHGRAFAGRAGLSRRRRHRAGAQHRDGALAGRRQDHRHLLRGRAGRPAGFVLAKIDPTTYQAQYDQAVASKAKDEAQLANARVDFERYTRLAATNAVNKQQLDTQKALVAQLEAQVKLDQAAIDNARAILSYTDVVAPIAGRTGIRLVDQGNLVRAADTTGIVILTQLRPISVFFSLPQQTLPDLNKGMAEGQLPVDALNADGKGLLDKGKVVVIDNQVDQTTGTVKIKAEFPNTNLQLWPGQFINVRVLIDTLRNVVVVPTAAIQRGPNGAFVYVLKDDSTVTVRRVSLTQLDDVQAVVATGLQAGERVVTTGFARLTEGRRSRPRARRMPARSRPARGRARPGWNPRHPRRRARKADSDRGRTAGRQSMSVSSPFIHRPIATSLLGVAVMLGACSAISGSGLLAAAGRFPHHPGDDPASGRQPRRHGLAGDGAARAQFRTDPVDAADDVVELVRGQPGHAAVRAQPRHRCRRAGRAGRDQCVGSVLPRNLPYPPVYSKVNPADTPMVTLAITSDTVSLRALSDIADTLLAQRLSELTGVGRVTVQGNIRPAIRIQADLSRLANYGIALEDMRNVIMAANVAGPRARSTARTSPTPSPPTTSSPPPRPIATSSSPIATAPRSCCATWPTSSTGWRTPGWAASTRACPPSWSTSSASPAPT